MPDLEPKQKEQPQTSTQEIDLPEDTTDEVTLPEMHNDPGNDLLTADFLDTDNATLLGIDAAPVPDFVKEMLIEQGIDWDLEFKLLTFLEQQNIEENMDKQKKSGKNSVKSTGGRPRGSSSRDTGVTPKSTKCTGKQKKASNTHTPGLPRGSGRQPFMVFGKNTDLPIPRIMDVKSTDNFCHLEVKSINIIGGITCQSCVLYARKVSVALTLVTDICTPTTPTKNMNN